MDRPVQSEPTLWCVKCGYNMSYLPDTRCPECGTKWENKQLIQENERLHVDLLWLTFRFAFVPISGFGMTMLFMSAFARGYWGAIPFMFFTIFATMIITTLIAFFTARNLSRFSTSPGSNGIGGRVSPWRVLVFWLLLSATACAAIWLAFLFIFSLIPIPDGP